MDILSGLHRYKLTPELLARFRQVLAPYEDVEHMSDAEIEEQAMTLLRAVMIVSQVSQKKVKTDSPVKF